MAKTKKPEVVTVIDDTYRTNNFHPVTDELRGEFAARGNPLHMTVKAFPMRDTHGRIMQTVYKHKVHYTGRSLVLAIARAKRYLRNAKTTGRPPKHISLAIGAFAQCFPSDYKVAMEARA